MQKLYDGYIKYNWMANPHCLVFVKTDRPKIADKTYYVMQKNITDENAAKAKFIINSDQYKFADYYSKLINSFYLLNDSPNGQALFYVVAAVTFAFAAFLIINFIVYCINSAKAEIGIFRAVGASKKDILFIYLIEAALFGFVVFILSFLVFNFLGLPFLCIFNVQALFLPFKMFTLNIFDVLFLGGAIAILSCASVFLPFARIINKPPNQILSDDSLGK